MTGFARWCFRHRKTVLAVWLIALVAFLGIGRSVGSSNTKSFSLPGTGSTQAQSVLQADFPVQAGDSEQIVMQAKRGTLRTPAVEAAVGGMLAKVSRLPDVRSVASPYRSAGQISADGTIGFATVTLDAAAQDVPKASVTRLVSTAQSAGSPVLQVQLGGQAIEDNQPSSGSSDLLLGVVLALIVLFFAFRRSILGAALPLISALAAIGIASPAIDALSHAMPVASFAPQVAVLVALGVGVDYSLFVVSRHRAGLLAGQVPEESAVTALNTSGRAVLLADTTVCVAILGLFALQVSFLYGVAVSVALTMLASLTLLPAMLGFLGSRVLRKGERAAAGTHHQDDSAGWHRWAQTAALVGRVRSSASRAEAGTSLRIYVGGNTAVNQDFSQVLTAKMPQFIAVVVGLAFVLLALVFRSLLIPLLASVMNLLSFGAALGVMTAAFQFGWGKSLLGFGQSGPVVSYLPVMMFAILFGLSTDYEVFLVSRMHEEWMVASRVAGPGAADTAAGRLPRCA